MSTEDELYPFSTQNGDSIPLDIIKPRALQYFTFTTTFATVVLSNKLNLAMVWASEDCILDLVNSANALTSGTERDNWLFIPKAAVVACVLPTATVRVRGLSASGSLMVQGIHKWSILALPRQIGVKVS